MSDITVRFSSDGPEKRRKPKVRSIACGNHEWVDVFSRPKRDAALLKEYFRWQWEDFQRCGLCQRISQKRWDWRSGIVKHYTDKPKIFSLEDSLAMMSRTVIPWNEKVSESEESRSVSLRFGKIAMYFASADDQPLCDSGAEIESDPETFIRDHYELPQVLRVEHGIKEKLYSIARDFYRQLDDPEDDDD